ncbi:hypothetical protein Leryth_017012 [Lithospermum erythrorhizon]|nr:hypothetical protein Leryth_017012 [Lithospermum erythrorhizon]
MDNKPSLNHKQLLPQEDDDLIKLVENEGAAEAVAGEVEEAVEEMKEVDGGGEEKSEDSGLGSAASVDDTGGTIERGSVGDKQKDVHTQNVMIDSKGEDKFACVGVPKGDEMAVEENLVGTNTVEVVEEMGENAKVELEQPVIGVAVAIGNEDSVVHNVEPMTTDCDDTTDGVTLVAPGKMDTDICAESDVRVGEGSKSEHASTPCDHIVGTEVANVEKDEVKDVAMEDNLVDVAEKEKGKEVELVESDVSKDVKEKANFGVEKNDDFKEMEGNSSFGDDKLEAENEVGMKVEECLDSKEVDSESTVSESFADKSGKDDEVEGAAEVGDDDIRMETEADTEGTTVEITKGEEPDATGDSDTPQALQDEEMVAEEETNAETEAETEADVAESGKAAKGKRKRGKNGTPANTKSTPKSRKTIEEDVCFICFDGGDLVLCDRRGCPKAYHPSCVNRDEEFFTGNCRWNCGWHMCSICEKNAQYFCYTCPFSLCKGCTKDAAIFCVRGKKGFCNNCMKVVKLLENEQDWKNDQVDFDGTGCLDPLFRDYYIELKSKLSLSSAEITKAKSPGKGLDTSARKDDKLHSGIQDNRDVEQKSPDPPSDHRDDAEPDGENSNQNEEATKPRRKKVKKRLKPRGRGRTSSSAAESVSDEDGPVDTKWASNGLLEFVMHMKNGDRSILSEYDVQALLLEYIKRNNLRDPRQKSRIICDSRLQSLFGKPRVGHFEMLKLLESHFFIKENSHTDDVQGSVVDTNSEQLEVDENADTPKGTKEKQRKSRKKGARRGPQSNLDDYAAIDMHNISLIYLRRKLMEDLLEDSETFKDKVNGTFVRIRISGSVQKQDIYRLVQVVGTSNAADPYKVGKKSTSIMVEILNLNKTEVIPIDTISNQDFTEDECKRLRQSMKCGLINRLTVGDILDKARELQTAKVNDWLETEVVRLSHLRDRASDMGRKKELRECVEKLQLLKTPEERQRRLDAEIPEIHADPKMDPTYESEEDDIDFDENRQDVYTKIRGPGSRGGRGQISPGSDILSKDPWSGGAKYASKNLELDRNLSSKEGLNHRGDSSTQSGEVQGETSWNQVRDRTKLESSNLDKFGSTLGSDTLRSESLSSSVSKQTPDLAKAVELTKINESEKNWHYKDPSGKVQGPFSMVQLRKWSNTGYFPAELKVWRSEKQEDSILLTDALSGKFQKEPSTTASNLPSSLSANLTNIMASLEHAREQQDREKLNTDQDTSGNLLSRIVSPAGQTTPSVEHPKPSNERWSRNECSSLPSPTPILNNAGFTREGVSLSSTASYSGRNGALPSPTAVSPDYQGHLSTPTSRLKSCETLVATENESVITGPSGAQVGHSMVSNTSQNSLPVVNSEAHDMQVQGNVTIAQDSFAPQIVGNQNPIAGTLGWGSGQSQKIDTNAVIPVQPEIQAYSQWGNIPATGYSHPGNFPQGNQPTMQFPALPNTSWAVGAPENNTTATSAPRPENPNPNFGWGVVQGNQNTMWVGAPPVNANVNWGAAPIQGPPSANQNMGWTMPPGNLGAAVQGQLPAGANPGWNAGTGNPPGQGPPPSGNVNQGWVAPQTGNPLSNVHMPASGSGWAPNPGNLGAPVLGQGQGNGNQSLSTPSGRQGPWGTDQNHSGSKFSSQRDQGSHGGDYGYGGNQRRSRPSFGNGGPGGPSRHNGRYHQTPCPYNRGGRCRKGAACNYMHT